MQDKTEEIKAEQKREEDILKEKEKEFHTIERIGMLAMIQRYFENKSNSKAQTMSSF